MLHSPATVAFLFALAGILTYLGVTRQNVLSPFAVDRRRATFYRKLETRLRLAGLADTSATVFMLGVAASATMAYLMGFMLTGNLKTAFFFIPVGIFIPSVYLSMRERSSTKRAEVDMPSLLEGIKSEVISGNGAQQAFLVSIDRTKYLKIIFERQVAQMRRPDADFIALLRDTARALPLRQWKVFVRQMELNYELGGASFAETLGAVIDQINASLMMDERKRTQVQNATRTQYIMIGLALTMLPILEFLVGGLISDLLNRGAAGIIVLSVGGGLILSTLLLSRRVARNFERWMNT